MGAGERNGGIAVAKNALETPATAFPTGSSSQKTELRPVRGRLSRVPDTPPEESFGLQLVRALSEQLQGTLLYTHEGGTGVTLTFPI